MPFCQGYLKLREETRLLYCYTCFAVGAASMMFQQKKIKDMCIAAEFIARTKCDVETVMGVKKGHLQLVFISSESLVTCKVVKRNVFINN